MLAKAVAKYVRMSPRKVRYVMCPLRRRTVAEALVQLRMMNRRACKPVAKAIASAFANARQFDPTLGEDHVVISRLVADGAPVWKRFRAAAFGRAVPIRKPTTHITVELDRRSGRGAVGPTQASQQRAAVPAKAEKPAASQRQGARAAVAVGAGGHKT